MTTDITRLDPSFFERAIELALQAEGDGNLPIGCVICRGEAIIAEGWNRIWIPDFAPLRHAEIEALSRLALHDRVAGAELTLYTTLEPCLMCAGAISLHRIGRVVFGSADPVGGAVAEASRLPPYFARHRMEAQWVGPASPEACDPLYERAMALIRGREGGLDGRRRATDDG